MKAKIEQNGEDRLWNWFGLGRASWITIPRSFAHAMPDEWQDKMAALLEEYDDTFCNQPDLRSHVRVMQNGRMITTPYYIANYRHPDDELIESFKKK